MAYQVSITASGGMVDVVTTGGDNNFSQSYQGGALTLRRDVGSETIQLLLVNGGETLCSFTFADVTAPSGTGDTDGLYDAIKALLAPSAELPTGAATEAKQDTGNTSLGSLVTGQSTGNSSLASIVTGQSTTNTALATLDASVNNNVPVVLKECIDASDGNRLYLRIASVGGVAGIGATDAVGDFIDLEGHVTVPVGDVVVVGFPVNMAIAQLTAQGGSSTVYIGGRAGSFTYSFTLGAGTSGVLTLYGNDNGVDEMVAATATLTGDGTGVIRWTAPYKTVKAVFTTQVGAGSTFDGTVYAN